MSVSLNQNMMAARAAKNLGEHYSGLAASVRRLSSGLRIDRISDDAAGLAIRELMRADISTLSQGVRNANDAISMVQVADGALQIIDEKLIRMKELATQAATGTYTSDQRLMLDSEFQAMAAEINRIAASTDFNGIQLLNGNLHGAHDGAGLGPTGGMKVHFGPGNDAAEDYYYVDIPPADIPGLGLAGETEITRLFPGGPPGGAGGSWVVDNVPIDVAGGTLLGDGITLSGPGITYTGHVDSVGTFVNGQSAGLGPPMSSGLILSTGNVTEAQGGSATPSENMGVSNGAGDSVFGQVTQDESVLNVSFTTDADMIYFNFVFASEEYPEYVGSAFNDICGIFLNGVNQADLAHVISVDQEPPPAGIGGPISINNVFTPPNEGLLYQENPSGPFPADAFTRTYRIGIPVVPGVENTLQIAVADVGDSALDSWILVNDISAALETDPVVARSVVPLDIKTQTRAQVALERIDSAIILKDKIRADLGSTQNRLENTASNLQIQAENMQMSESRISDADVAVEMTDFVRRQMLSQSAVAMLAQANATPQMVMQLLQGRS